MSASVDDFKAFTIVAKTGSMRRAADQLGMSPSIISRQIAKLEEIYGRALFERRPNGVQLFGLNYWSSTTAKSAQYDEAKGEWTVILDRNGQEGVLHPKQLVLATGMSGKPNVPVIAGQDLFKGEQQHSSEHPGP